MAKLAIYFVVAVVVCQSASVFSRQIDFDNLDFDQGNGNGNNNNNNNNVQPTPATFTTTTTASPRYRNCIANCQITAQYNPVCGTNQENYNNINALRCAQNCGLRVEVSHIGTCRSSAGGK